MVGRRLTWRNRILPNVREQGPQPGLGVIVLDALTRREWVQEDYVPRPREEGEAPDPKVRARCDGLQGI